MQLLLISTILDSMSYFTLIHFIFCYNQWKILVTPTRALMAVHVVLENLAATNARAPRRSKEKAVRVGIFSFVHSDSTLFFGYFSICFIASK